MAWMALTVGVILCGVSVIRGFQGQTFMGRPLGGDFVEFYTIGKILNNYAPARVYDLELAVSLQHATLPTMPATQMLVVRAGAVCRLALPAVRAVAVRLGVCGVARILGHSLYSRSGSFVPHGAAERGRSQDRFPAGPVVDAVSI